MVALFVSVRVLSYYGTNDCAEKKNSLAIISNSSWPLHKDRQKRSRLYKWYIEDRNNKINAPHLYS